MKALEKTKNLPLSASKSVKLFCYETDFNGEGQMELGKSSSFWICFVLSSHGTLLKKKTR